MTFRELINNSREKFNALDSNRKMGFVALAVLAVAILTVSIIWGTAPDYQYLFTDLNDTDASMIVQKLKESNTPYKLTKGGTAVMVPEQHVYETRLTLAAQGLPKGGVGQGFSLFDETSFSTSEFVQKINYQRALQNELANTIMSLEEVDFARVHIVLPKESVFIEDEQPAKASIVVKPKPGSRLSNSQVQGIVYLAAKSIRGLESENISIVDIKGRVLFEGRDEESAASFASNHLEVKHNIEHMLESRAQEMLEKIAGPGAAIVKVSADVNMDMVKSVQDNYDPEIQIIRSEELKGSFSGTGDETGGVPGTQSNLPTARGGAIEIPQNANSGNSSVVRNYEIARSQTEIIQSPGDIKRLTISVVVDGTYETAADGNRSFVPRSDDELKRIEDAVKYAVGYSADREDIISVSSMPFAQEDADLLAMAEKAKRNEFITSLIKPLVTLLTVLLILLFVIRPMMKWMSGSVKTVERVPQEQPEIEGEETAQIESEDMAQIEAAAAKSDEMKSAVMGQRKAIENIKESDVDSATAVIKSWLQEKE